MTVTMTWPQYRRRECSYKGWRTRLAPQEAEVLSTLLVRRPLPTRAPLLYDALWGDDPEGGALRAVNALTTIMARLKAKLPGAIVGGFKYGWSIA